MNTLPIKNIYAVGFVSLILGILFDYLFFDKRPGISFIIYVVLLLSGLFGFLLFFKISHNKKAAWFLPAILFFSLMAGVRDNELLLFWNIVLTIGLLLLLAQELIGLEIRNALYLDYLKTIVVLPLNMIGKSFNALGRMLSIGKGVPENRKTSQITKGILITLPVVLFFLFLLSSADLVFDRLVFSLFDFDLNPDVMARIFWAAAFAFLWLGVYAYILENVGAKENASPLPVVRHYKFGGIEAGILFTSLNVLFLTFVIIQIKYLFAGHSAVTQLGFTYAEYAHKGFGELVAVALLTFGLIFLAERFIEREGNQTKPVFKILTGVLIILVLVIMASAFTRLSIYEQAYGFTLLRILAQAFIVWLTAVFLWLGYKIARGVGDRAFLFGIFLSVVMFFAVFNLLNPDAFVARKNIEQFANAGKLDIEYLSSLSTDAVPQLIPLLESEAEDKNGNRLSHEVAVALKKDYDSASNQPWQSFNMSRSRAIRLIDSKRDLISALAGQDAPR